MKHVNRFKNDRKSAVILMTALVPHVGHQAMIEFARLLVGTNGFVDVIISERSHEPVTANDRIMAFRRENNFIQNACVATFIRHSDDHAPQNPNSESEWNYWKDVVLGNRDSGHYDFLVASEPYGRKMADLIGAEFVPFDIDRAFITTKGTPIRENMFENMHNILPGLAEKYVCKVTMFGQESTGKTTMTNQLNSRLSSYMIHEFARPYLEMMDDKTVTDQKMWTITEGQYALQRTAYQKTDRPFIFCDTDLGSTIGYYGIYGGEPHPKIEKWFMETKSDLYLVMNDEIPFEQDELRYGGNVRESSKQYWIDLLEKYDCNYHVMQSVDRTEQVEEAIHQCLTLFDSKTRAIRDFKRD